MPPMERLQQYLSLLEHHPLHPLQKGGKKALLKKWQNLEVIERDVRFWFAQGMNFGINTKRAAVLDFDEKEPAREFFKQHRQLIKTIVETRRGVHFYFRNEGHIRNTTGTPDVRGIGGYVVAPGSVVEGHEYKFVEGYDEIDPQKMEPLRAEWLPKRESVSVGRTEITNGVRYISQIHAIAGEGGHNATFRAVCKLRDSGMSEIDAIEAMLEWNQTNAEPQWSVKEICHKVRDAFNAGVSSD